MIPQIIHYVWLSQEPLNDTAKLCLQSWKKNAPHFTIKKWTLDDFDIKKFPLFVQEAIQAKKWAFACDYLRLFILYHEGGWYFDSDVFMLKPPKISKKDRFVSSVEYYEELFKKDAIHVNPSGIADKDMIRGMAIQAAIMGSEKKHLFLKECMDYYHDKHFKLPRGGMLAPHIYALIAQNFGFRYKNEEQFLKDGIHLLKSEIFAPDLSKKSKNTRLIHLCSGSWRTLTKKEREKSYTITKYKLEKKILLSLFGIKILTVRVKDDERIYHFLGIKFKLKS